LRFRRVLDRAAIILAALAASAHGPGAELAGQACRVDALLRP